MSTDTKYSKYSFKTIAGFYQWVKILQKPEEINAASWLSDLFELTNDEINCILGDDQYLNNEYVKCNAELATTFNFSKGSKNDIPRGKVLDEKLCLQPKFPLKIILERLIAKIVENVEMN